MFSTAVLVLCLVMCRAVCATPYEGPEEVNGLVERLLSLLEAQRESGGQTPSNDQPECNLQYLDEKFWWCFGRHCTYEVLPGKRIIDVMYETTDDVTITLMDLDLRILQPVAKKTKQDLPVSLSFSVDTNNYEVKVSSVTPLKDETYAIEACVDFNQIN